MHDLVKKLPDPVHHGLANSSEARGRTVVSDAGEQGADPASDAHQALHQVIHGSEEGVGRFFGEGSRKASGTPGGIQAKAVVEAGGHRFLLKPYHSRTLSEDSPISGWAEMTNQALYHAAGLGHLHQDVHVVHPPPRQPPPGNLKGWGKLATDPDFLAARARYHNTPWAHLAVRMAPGHEQVADAETGDLSEEARRAGHRIATMDFLGGNADRHGGNLMLSPEGMPLAIDHGRTFAYGDGFDAAEDSPADHRMELAAHLGGLHGDERHDLSWWKEASPRVRAAFQQRLQLVKHSAAQQHLRQNFERRADVLDRLAAMPQGTAAEKAAAHKAWDEPTENILTPGLPR